MKPVFIHVSKNAGTSIVSAADGAITSAGHRTAASWIAGHGTATPLFGVVRDPVDRVLSEYHYRRRRWSAGEDNPHLANLHLGFDDWVRATYEGDEFRTRSFFERTGVPYNPRNLIDDVLVWFIPQTRWLGGADGRLLVEDVLRFEQLAADWATFCAKYDIDRELVHVNTSQRPPRIEQEVTRHTLDIIHEYYRVDFDRFGYERRRRQ